MRGLSINACRHCGAPIETTVCDLGVQPPSNFNLKPENLASAESFLPLRACVCSQCWLVQLDYFEDAASLFDEDYAYFSSYSTSWLEHAKRYSEMMRTRFALEPDALIAELASNDGYLLQNFKKAGHPVLGIEPSANVAQAAIDNHGIPTEVVFFGRETAKTLSETYGQAKLIAANNVLAHVPDINDFAGGVPVLLAPDGVATFEFPHLVSLLRHNQFDTIYHEHFSYLSLTAVRTIFASVGLRVFDVETIPTHGGSLRVFACHQDAAHETAPAVEEMLAAEDADGLRDIATYSAYQEQVDKVKRDFLTFLIGAKEAGKTVVGYGAPAKGNTLLNYAGVRGDLMDYVVDRSPAKQGRFLPGTRLPVLAPEEIEATKPDYVVIMPWNLRDEIAEQMAHIRNWGGQFVVAIPAVEIF